MADKPLTGIKKMVSVNDDGVVTRMYWAGDPPDADFKEEVFARWGWSPKQRIPVVTLESLTFHLEGKVY